MKSYAKKITFQPISTNIVPIDLARQVKTQETSEIFRISV
jgi:hypothetical protein